MIEFYSDYNGFTMNGLSAEEYFYMQTFEAFKANVENQSLPFFNNDLNKIPRELSTGKIINNENAIALEQIASLNGYKSNLWIYGDELNKIQKEVGNLYLKKGTMPVLCLTKYFGATHLNEQDLYISEAGTGKKEQYLYNLDSLNEKSREKVMKYFEQANAVDKKYTSENLKAFQINIEANRKGTNENFRKMREKVIQESKHLGLDLTAITNCHYIHQLGNSIGKPELAEQKNANQKDLCYWLAGEFIKKAAENKILPKKAGMMLCTALNAGTEFQRLSVAKGYNLENAKKIEEMQVAEANRNRGYGNIKSGGISY